MNDDGGLARAGAGDGTALRELLLEEGDDFVEAAYLALLNRRPDAHGGPEYLRALRDGRPKLAILYELYSSPESRRLGADVPGLVEAFAREGIGEAPGAARAAASIQSAEQLLVIEDPHQFIAMAYRVLLKRPADLEGIASYKTRMHEGFSRTRVLHDLFSSDERRRLGTELPGLRAAFRREGLGLPDEAGGAGAGELEQPAQTLAQLLGLHGAAFVQCAHLTLLKRPVEEALLYQQVARLRAGESKLQLLSELASSPPAAAAASRLPGLSATLSRYRLARVPLLGAVLRRFVDVEGNTPAERRARGSEQRVLALEAALAEQLERFEREGQRAEARARELREASHALETRIASLERSDVALRKLTERYMERAPELDPGAAAAASHVPAARLVLDARAEEIYRDLRKADR